MKRALFAIAWAAFVLVATHYTTARAHDAIPTAAQPRGWAYPGGCCSSADCREVDRVKESPGGYIVLSGEVISYDSARIKDSPDGVYHWCTVQGLDTTSTICLFVPPKGF